MKTILKQISLFLLICVFAVTAFAEEQTPPAPGTPPPPPPRMCAGSAEFSFVNTTGNTSTQTLGLGGTIECKPGKWDYLAKGAFIRSEADKVETAKTIDTLFRASRELTARLKGYGQFIYFQNPFSGIDNRYALE